MEPQSFQHIIAATATKRLELAGGSTMEQILPEEYALANFILRALEERNGQELEFVLKSYLRIHMVPIEKGAACFLVEPLGFNSAHFKLLNDFDITPILEVIKKTNSLDELLDLIRQIRETIESLVNAEESTLLGVVSKTQASEFMALLERPTKSEREAYAINFPEVLKRKDLEYTMHQLKSTIQIKNEIESQLLNLHHTLAETTTRLISEEEAVIRRMENTVFKKLK